MADLLVLLLLLSPIDPPVPRRAPEPMWQALKRVALALEIVGPQERWLDGDGFKSELGYVRRHFRELRDAPPLDDACLLPPAHVATQMRTLNATWQRTLELRQQVELHHADALSDALREARLTGEVWCLVETAACPGKSWVCRRRALGRLRELLGPDAYYTGWRPGPVGD